MRWRPSWAKALLERLPRGVWLTAAGRQLLSEARAAIAQAQRARHAVRQALNLEVGQLGRGSHQLGAAGNPAVVLRD